MATASSQADPILHRIMATQKLLMVTICQSSSVYYSPKK